MKRLDQYVSECRSVYKASQLLGVSWSTLKDWIASPDRTFYVTILPEDMLTILEVKHQLQVPVVRPRDRKQQPRDKNPGP